MAYEKPFRGKPLRLASSDVGRWQQFSKEAQREKLRQSADHDTHPLSHCLVAWCRNDSNQDVPRFGIVGIGSSGITPATNEDEWKDRWTFAGEAPSSTYRYKLAVALEPIKADKWGICCVEGVTQALVNVNTTVHDFATFKSGDNSQFDSAWWGTAEIISREDAGTGELKKCVVRLGKWTHKLYRGKTDASHNKSATGTVSVWTGTAGSTSDSGQNITSVYNPFANVGSGKWVDVGWVNDGPELVAAEC